MNFTISGLWTAVIIVILMTIVLYVITRNSELYKAINPNTIIIASILIILRAIIPMESTLAKGIFVRDVVPEVDTVVRLPIFTMGRYTITVLGILVLLWMGVSGIKVYRMVWQYIDMKKTLNSYEPLGSDQILCVTAAEKEMKVSGRIKYKLSDKYTSPFIFGFWKSIIVMPVVIKNFSDEETYMMLCHELSHHKKKDGMLKIFFELFSCVFWWFPFINRLKHKCDEAMEIRADWNTIRNMTENQKRQYLIALYRMAEIVSKHKNTIFYSNMFYSAQVKCIEKRFRFIKDYKKWHMTVPLILIMIGIFAASYLIVIEPQYGPSDAAVVCENSCHIYKQSNGSYEIYMDGSYVGNVKDIDFLSDTFFEEVSVKINEEDKSENE